MYSAIPFSHSVSPQFLLPTSAPHSLLCDWTVLSLWWAFVQKTKLTKLTVLQFGLLAPQKTSVDHGKKPLRIELSYSMFSQYDQWPKEPQDLGQLRSVPTTKLATCKKCNVISSNMILNVLFSTSEFKRSLVKFFCDIWNLSKGFYSKVFKCSKRKS